MEHPGFFERAGPFSLRAMAEAAGASPAGEVDLDTKIKDVRPLDAAGRGDLSFLDNPKYLPLFAHTGATACLVAPKFAGQAPAGTAALVTTEPYRGFAKVLALFYPDALKPKATRNGASAPFDGIDRSARLEDGVAIEPGAVIGPEASIGRGTTIAAGTVIGYRVYVGRDCYVGPNATVTHALVGNRVTIHAGASIGQDGFGFAMGRAGHQKVPQIGRVIIQDDVEIGANTTIDRGALRDTVIGEGTKIDNLAQIGHNVVGHVKIGAGAQIAGSSNVRGNVPPGVRWGGTPAKPTRLWFRELTILRQLAERKDLKFDDKDGGE
jgi:UDP-3-O-[3-hydroxymyristoyl] glucosamine N-acyltransferase